MIQKIGVLMDAWKELYAENKGVKMSDNKETLIDQIICTKDCAEKKVCPVHEKHEYYTELSQYLFDGLIVRYGKNMSIFVGCVNYKSP